MAFDIDIKPSALKSLKKIPQLRRRRIAKRIDKLADDPRSPEAKKLAGEDNLYRVRVGDYRIVYKIEDDVLLVL